MIHSSSSINQKGNRVYIYYYWGKPNNLDAVERIIKTNPKYRKVYMLNVDELLSSLAGAIEIFHKDAIKKSEKIKKIEEIINTDILLPTREIHKY